MAIGGGNLLKLLVKEIEDRYVQENFLRLNNYFAQARNLVGFQHMEIRIMELGTNIKIPHNLGIVPKDVLVTAAYGPALVQFNYQLFDRTNLDVTLYGSTPTAANPVIVRAYVGTHIGGTL